MSHVVLQRLHRYGLGDFSPVIFIFILFVFIFYDHLHGWVFPLAFVIARGSVLPVAPMFLGHLYCLLHQVQLLEKGST